jgi:NADPH:quinone reductase-like Zn-dependent oxidoreductase
MAWVIYATIMACEIQPWVNHKGACMHHQQRRVFVTGATSGIGEAIAQAFAAQGAWVMATGATQAKFVTGVVLPVDGGGYLIS